MSDLMDISKGFKDRIAGAAAKFNPGSPTPGNIIRYQEGVARATDPDLVAAATRKNNATAAGLVATGAGLGYLVRRNIKREAKAAAKARRKKIALGTGGAVAAGAAAPVAYRAHKERKI